MAAAGPAVVIVAATAVLPALARALEMWLRTRRSDITVTKRVNDPEHALREVHGEQAT
jgi:Effector Associated Constant Component 1